MAAQEQLALPDATTFPLGELLALPDEQYAADQSAVRNTWLRYLIKQTPAHLQTYRAGLDPQTEEQKFGIFFHNFVLEPSLTGSRYYREPELGNRNSKAVKEQLAALAADNVGKIAIREAQYDAAVAMRDAVYRHKAARAMLELDGHFERSIFWDNAETGELCKARYDKVSTRGAGFIADIKTTKDASPHGFFRSGAEWLYHVQAHHYVEPTGLRFVLIACEKTAPWGVACYAIDDATLKKGRQSRLPALSVYAECKAKNEWPCYPQFVQRFELPRWAA